MESERNKYIRFNFLCEINACTESEKRSMEQRTNPKPRRYLEEKTIRYREKEVIEVELAKL
jgi:hypothetical protein